MTGAVIKVDGRVVAEGMNITIGPKKIKWNVFGEKSPKQEYLVLVRSRGLISHWLNDGDLWCAPGLISVRAENNDQWIYLEDLMQFVED